MTEDVTLIRGPFPWRVPTVEELVDRQEQIDEFSKTLRRIRQQRPLSPTLYEWYGGPGIGKTQLIRLFIKVCEEQECYHALMNFKGDESAGQQGMVQSQTDFDSVESHLLKERQERLRRYVTDPTKLIEEMAKSLISPEAFANDPLRKRLETLRRNDPPSNIIDAYFQLTRNDLLYNRPAWVEDMRNVAASFIGLINALGREEKVDTTREVSFTRPVALFFDETDYADEKLVNWLEEWVIGPLLAIKHCVIIWTARSPWRWQRPDIRRLVRSQTLLPFSQDESKNQIQRGISRTDLVDELFGRVFALTHGHPAANTVALEQIEQWSIVAPPPQDVSTEREKELLQAIFDRVILQYAFQRLSPEEIIACRLMALVRWFDTVMLREVLQASGGNSFEDWTQEDFGYLLQRLKRTQLLAWRKGFTLDLALRPIIHDYYRVCDPIAYVAVNKIALQVYEQWLVRPVDNRNLYVVEELYHLVLLQHAGESVSPEDHLKRRLQQYREWIPDVAVRHHVLELLQGEIGADVELKKLDVSASLSHQVQAFLEQDPPEVIVEN